MEIDTFPDFTAKYNNTFLQLKNETRDVVFVNRTLYDGRHNLVELHYQNGGTDMQIYPGCLNLFNLVPPNSLNFNYKGYSLRLYRRPERQWKVGLSSEHYSIINILSKFLSDYEPVYRPLWGLGLAAHIFKPEYPTSMDSLLATLEQKVSVALSRNISISLNMTNNPKQYFVWYRTIPVGFFMDGQFDIRDYRYQQEVIDETKHLC